MCTNQGGKGELLRTMLCDVWPEKGYIAHCPSGVRPMPTIAQRSMGLRYGLSRPDGAPFVDIGKFVFVKTPRISWQISNVFARCRRRRRIWLMEGVPHSFTGTNVLANIWHRTRGMLGDYYLLSSMVFLEEGDHTL